MTQEIIHDIQSYWTHKIDPILSENFIESLFVGSITFNTFSYDSKLGKKRITLVQDICDFIINHPKMIQNLSDESAPNRLMSDTLNKIYQKFHLHSVIDSQLYKNFQVFETWSFMVFSTINAYANSEYEYYNKLNSSIDIESFSLNDLKKMVSIGFDKKQDFEVYVNKYNQKEISELELRNEIKIHAVSKILPRIIPILTFEVFEKLVSPDLKIVNFSELEFLL